MKKIRKTLENTKRATTFVDNNEINARLEFAKNSTKTAITFHIKAIILKIHAPKAANVPTISPVAE